MSEQLDLLARHRDAPGDRRVRRAGDDGGRAGLRPARRADRGLRQRRHALVREADADRARLHPRCASRRWPRPTSRCASSSRGRRRTSGTTRWLGDAITKHYHGDDSRREGADGRHPRRRSRDRRSSEYSDAADAFLRGGKHPTLGRAFHECGYQPMVELLALPRGERVHQLHRLRRRSRLHAPGHRARSTASRPSA